MSWEENNIKLKIANAKKHKKENSNFYRPVQQYTEIDTDMETDSDFSCIRINSDARKSRVKKTELSIMASFFELITF